MWVIRNSNGLYVAQAGSKSSFTSSLEKARKFNSRESAQADCCGNEHPESVDAILGRSTFSESEWRTLERAMDTSDR